MTFEIISPEKKLVEENVDALFLPAKEGFMEILDQHTPLITLVKKGIIRYRRGDNSLQQEILSSGVAHITPQKTTLLIAQF